MLLTMADGPVVNLPVGQNAYAGYVDDGGIGITFPGVVARFPLAQHFSISVHGSPAMCGDVEKGALSSWKGYDYGYCNISSAQTLIDRDGRPEKLWTAHYGIGPHICSPSCGFGFTGNADGTQWTDNGGRWDASLLLENFFSLAPPPLPPLPREVSNMIMNVDLKGNPLIVGNATDNGDLMFFSLVGAKWSVVDITESIHNANPADSRSYKIV